MTKNLAILVLMLLLLAACGDEQENSLPTAAQLVEEEPTPTREIAETVEIAPTATARPRERPTLPPTWTATPLPDTPTPTITATPLPTIEIDNPPEECGPFGPDTSVTDEEFTLGESPTIGWRSVETAGSYWVVIFDPNRSVIHERFTEELSYIIPWEVFAAPVRYGWEVRPLDVEGIQMCDARGGRLIARSGS